jgi:predicted TIM-barrel fold metal-dependent hydrolase
LVIEGRNYPEAEGPGAGCPREHGLSTADGIDYSSAEGVLGDADRDQIDTMVLYPSLGLCAPTLEDPDFAAGFARLYNRWIADYCAASNGRLRGIAVTPIEHGEVAIDVMREAKDLGLVATHIPPALKTRNLDHPDLDRFYAAAEDLDMPLGIHGAPGMHLPKVGVDRFTNYIQVHCISFPFDQMTAMTAMISGGVFDRHPGLRVAFLEAGVGWVPFFIDRLHEHFEKRGHWIDNGWQRDPLEYLAAGNIWTTCEPEEPILPGVIDVLGDDFIMFASDYPHWDGEWPESTKHLRTRPDISEETRAKIGGLNAKKFYALN